MKTKIISIFALLLLRITTYSQDSVKYTLFKDRELAFSGGVSFQHQLMGELGLMYYQNYGEGPCNPAILVEGPKVSAEFNFSSSHFIIAPKLSYEADFVFIGVRLNIIDYRSSEQNDYRFTPEIGLTLIGDMDLFYGYNIPISSVKDSYVTTNRLTLTVNILPQK